MSNRAADLVALARVPANRAVFEWLETRSQLKDRRSSSAWDIDEYVLHSHPDLSERLDEVGEGLSGGGRHVGVRGYAALVDDQGVIRVVAMGNAGFAVRIRDDVVRAEIAVHSRFATTAFGDGWIGADPWPWNLPRAEGTAHLRAWLQAAFAEEPVVPGGS